MLELIYDDSAIFYILIFPSYQTVSIKNIFSNNFLKKNTVNCQNNIKLIEFLEA